MTPRVLKKDNCKSVKIGCMSLQIFFLRTTAPEMLMLISKLEYTVQISNCQN